MSLHSAEVEIAADVSEIQAAFLIRTAVYVHVHVGSGKTDICEEGRSLGAAFSGP
jgi:hypothetical protein